MDSRTLMAMQQVLPVPECRAGYEPINDVRSEVVVKNPRYTREVYLEEDDLRIIAKLINSSYKGRLSEAVGNPWIKNLMNKLGLEIICPSKSYASFAEKTQRRN